VANPRFAVAELWQTFKNCHICHTTCYTPHFLNKGAIRYIFLIISLKKVITVKKLFIFLLLFSGLFATEIVVDGAYSGLLGNPFQAKLGVKSQDISVSAESKMIPIEVSTNRNDFGSIYRKPEFTINSSSCQNVMKTFFAEKYNVVNSSNNKASCKIENVKVNISYVFEKEQWTEQISNIEVETAWQVKLSFDGVAHIRNLNYTMDKTLGKDGTNYGLSIRTVWKPDTSSIEENIKKIIEYSMYRTLLEKDK